MLLDRTHESATRSWLESANSADGDFPLQNLPFGIFRRLHDIEPFRGGIALGEKVIDLSALLRTGLLQNQAEAAAVACTEPTLNRLFALGREYARALRFAVFDLFAQATDADRDMLAQCLVDRSAASYSLPANIGNYTDFYTSLDHAQNISKLLRDGGSAPPNFQWMPLAYHGRASSIGISGQPIRRPRGQIKAVGAPQPSFGPCRHLDYELELGVFIGANSIQGVPVSIDRAYDHVFGLCLLNDWSARDVQAWESSPLGPFLAKNFATTISPWIVTLDALAPFRCEWTRHSDEPQPLAYLDDAENRNLGALDITLEVHLETEHAQDGSSSTKISRTNFRHQYWTIAQMVAHHTVGGCNLMCGDVLGTGTISGPGEGEAGALMEVTSAGKSPIQLSNGDTRGFLEDGDEVVMTASCTREGFARIGFGENRAQVLPAIG